MMQDCLSSAGIVPGLHLLHVPVSPALPCAASGHLRCVARRVRSGGLSRTDRRTIVAGSVVDVRVLPGFAGLACKPVGAVLLPHAIRAALPSTTQRKSATTIGSAAARAVALQKFARTRTRTSCDANRCWWGAQAEEGVSKRGYVSVGRTEQGIVACEVARPACKKRGDAPTHRPSAPSPAGRPHTSPSP